MKQDLFLWLIMVVLMHVYRFAELCQYTDIKTFKDYVNLNGKTVFYLIVATQILAFAGFELLKTTSK